MGNIWSGPHSWNCERKTFVESCRRSPARVCPQCARPVRFLYAPYKLVSPFKLGSVPDPAQEDWACRFCHGLVYESQYPKHWENGHKRTLSARLTYLNQQRAAREEKNARRLERQLQRLQKRPQTK